MFILCAIKAVSLCYYCVHLRTYGPARIISQQDRPAMIAAGFAPFVTDLFSPQKRIAGVIATKPQRGMREKAFVQDPKAWHWATIENK